MRKSDFGEEFPIFIMLEGLFRRAVRSEAPPERTESPAAKLQGSRVAALKSLCASANARIEEKGA
jgi:hypothetical protein